MSSEAGWSFSTVETGRKCATCRGSGVRWFSSGRAQCPRLASFCLLPHFSLPSLPMFNVSPCTGLVCGGLDRLPSQPLRKHYRRALYMNYSPAFAWLQSGMVIRVYPKSNSRNSYTRASEPLLVPVRYYCVHAVSAMQAKGRELHIWEPNSACWQATSRLHFYSGMLCDFGKHMMEPSRASSRALHLT